MKAGHLLIGVAVLGLVTALGLGCRERLSSSPGVIRLLPETSGGAFQAELLGERVEVLDSHFSPDGWQPRGPENRWQLSDDTVIVTAGGKPFDLVRRTSLTAADLQTLEVTLASTYKVAVSVAWRQRGETGWKERWLQLGYNEARGEPRHKVFHFDLRSHEEFSGEIVALRVRFEPVRQDERIVVQRVVGSRQAGAEHDLAEAGRRSWRVELDRELRESLLVAPSHPVEHAVRVPPNGVLRFGLGATGRLATPVTLRVIAERSENSEVLFESQLDPVEDAAGRAWRDAEVDLSHLAGKSVRLRFESSSASVFDPGLGLPVVAHPEVFQRDRTVAGQQPNIILISIDTLRADHLSLYGYPRNTSPHLDAWARRHAVLFRHTVAQAPWTLPSHSSMLTGLDALRHGVNHPFVAAPAEVTTLAERLRDAGYFTAGITGGGWLNPHYGLAQGYDRYRYWIGGQRGHEEIASQAPLASQWLGELREPFFLFFHSYDVHDFKVVDRPQREVPVIAASAGLAEEGGTSAEEGGTSAEEGGTSAEEGGTSATFAEEGGTSAEGTSAEEGGTSAEEGGTSTGLSLRPAPDAELVPLYDSAIVHMDEHLGRILEAFHAAGLRGRSVITLTSDHGEDLGEDRVYGHGSLRDQVVLVPLVMETPDGAGAGLEITTQVRSVDIVPTLLDVAGIDLPDDLDGVSLRPFTRGERRRVPRVASTYFSMAHGLGLRAGRWKYTYDSSAWTPNASREALYALPGGELRERDDVAASEPQAAQFRELAHTLLTTRLAGLRLRFTNRLGVAWTGRLRGDPLHVAVPKTIDLEAGWLERGDEREANFSLPAGASFHLLFERLGEPRLEVTAWPHDQPEPQRRAWLAVDLEDLPQTLCWDGMMWDRESGTVAREDAACIVLDQQHGGGIGESTPYARDPELEKQLQALGYLG